MVTTIFDEMIGCDVDYFLWWMRWRINAVASHAETARSDLIVTFLICLEEVSWKFKR